ncbi:MAG: tetratricopeptide repeat protein [Pseudomonadota bacterium]
MHRLATLPLAFALLGAPQPAAAQSQALRACADTGLPVTTTLSVCRRALEDDLSPDQRAAVWVALGVAQAALGRHREAVGSFGEALAIDPELVQAYANRARSHAAENRLDAAAADFEAALARDAAQAEIWIGRAAVFLRQDKPRPAIADLTRAIGLDPDLTAAFYNRGLAYLLAGEAGPAADDFTTVTERDPEDAGAWLNRARARAELGEAAARLDFDRALRLDPDWGRAWYARGLYLERQGAREAAEADYLRAFELGVQDRWLVERVQGLRRN